MDSPILPGFSTFRDGASSEQLALTQNAAPVILPAHLGKDARTLAMEGRVLVSNRSVLIVDRSETGEVLKTALERRGVQIFSAEQVGQGLELAREHQPDLIVLDLESGGAEPEEVCARFNEPDSADRPLVLLGTISRQRQQAVRGEFVAKPYHYAPLIRRIEELLAARERVRAHCA